MGCQAARLAERTGAASCAEASTDREDQQGRVAREGSTQTEGCDPCR
jgi:hypothetical protein